MQARHELLLLVQPLVGVGGELWGRKMRVLVAARAVITIVRLAGPVLHANWRSPGLRGLDVPGKCGLQRK